MLKPKVRRAKSSRSYRSPGGSGRNTSSGRAKEALDRLSKATRMQLNGAGRLPRRRPAHAARAVGGHGRRLDAMLRAAALVQPPLDEFYAALNNEQKRASMR
jgi:hypothetical protein